jgi:hypothetical protein
MDTRLDYDYNADIANTISNRRKLLHFDYPVEKPYLRHYIPRYYSDFYPWLQWCFGTPCEKPSCIAEYNRVRVLPPHLVTTTSVVPTKKYPLYILLVAIVLLFMTTM